MKDIFLSFILIDQRLIAQEVCFNPTRAIGKSDAFANKGLVKTVAVSSDTKHSDNFPILDLSLLSK